MLALIVPLMAIIWLVFKQVEINNEHAAHLESLQAQLNDQREWLKGLENPNQ